MQWLIHRLNVKPHVVEVTFDVQGLSAFRIGSQAERAGVYKDGQH